MGKEKKKDKKSKDDKKKKKDDKKKLSKEDKKKLKNQKKETKKKKTSEVAVAASKSINDPNLSRQVKDFEVQARTGKLGAGAKTAAEEWAVAGKAEGIQVWRVEKFHIVAWPREEYGKFYNGDSYIVLYTQKNGNSFKWDIYLWIGSSSSLDEAGTGAYKMVELDDQLGGTPVQHREVQDYESDQFLTLFKPSIQILRGGIESGFNHVKPDEYETRLLHLKGKTAVRVAQVSVDSDSLNSGDVFVLDAGLVLYQWNGKQSSPQERQKGNEIARALRDERKSQPTVTTVEEGQEDAKFWELLGGKGPIASAEEGGDDREAEKNHSKSLFQLSDATGALKFTQKATGKVTKALFDTKDVFIFDSGFEIFAWIGKGASPNEKKSALTSAQSYLAQNNRPAYLPITRIIEGAEPNSFIAVLDK